MFTPRHHPGGTGGFAHGVIDKEICKIISIRASPLAAKPWNTAGSRPFFTISGRATTKTDCPEMRMRMPVSFLSASKAAVSAREEFRGMVRGG